MECFLNTCFQDNVKNKDNTGEEMLVKVELVDPDIPVTKLKIGECGAHEDER